MVFTAFIMIVDTRGVGVTKAFSSAAISPMFKKIGYLFDIPFTLGCCRRSGAVVTRV